MDSGSWSNVVCSRWTRGWKSRSVRLVNQETRHVRDQREMQKWKNGKCKRRKVEKANIKDFFAWLLEWLCTNEQMHSQYKSPSAQIWQGIYINMHVRTDNPNKIYSEMSTITRWLCLWVLGDICDLWKATFRSNAKYWSLALWLHIPSSTFTFLVFQSPNMKMIGYMKMIWKRGMTAYSCFVQDCDIFAYNIILMWLRINQAGYKYLPFLVGNVTSFICRRKKWPCGHI